MQTGIDACSTAYVTPCAADVAISSFCPLHFARIGKKTHQTYRYLEEVHYLCNRKEKLGVLKPPCRR